jgi:copper ion binding protein
MVRLHDGPLPLELTLSTIATYRINGMTCQHCVGAVGDRLGALDGVESVAVDLASGTAVVESAIPLQSSVVAAAVDDAGYELTP